MAVAAVKSELPERLPMIIIHDTYALSVNTIVEPSDMQVSAYLLPLIITFLGAITTYSAAIAVQ
jgi:hypothetical protein